MLVLKIVGDNWNNASRDKRELSVYRELGHEVLVMAKGSEGDYGRIDNVDGFKVLCYTTRPLGSKAPVILNRAFSLFEWAYFARALEPDVITAHDLLPGLIIAWLSTLFKKNKPQLIYDSHEFELGRNTDGKRSRFTTWAIAKIEKYLMGKCAFSIMVNDSIADEVQRIHGLKERPVVVRSTPNFWEINEEQCKEIRKELLAEFKKNRENVNCLLLYHHGEVKGRGIERL